MFNIAWDVVYEMFDEDGNFRTDNVWGALRGQTIVADVFKMVKQVDPDARRYITDTSFESNPAKAAAIVQLVQSLNSQYPGLIQGIGSETHLQQGDGPLVASTLATLATAGVEVAITALDITGAPVADYVAVAQACANTPACVSITSAGVSDAVSPIRIFTKLYTITHLLKSTGHRRQRGFTAVRRARCTEGGCVEDHSSAVAA
jgi:endo-1,4-beta-xylanase